MPTAMPPPAQPGTPARAAQMWKSIAKGNGWVKKLRPKPRQMAAFFGGLEEVTAATQQPFEVETFYEATFNNLTLQHAGLSIDDVIVEHAYQVYASGAGNCLGHCTTVVNGSNTTVRYEFVGSGAPIGLAASSLQTAMDRGTTGGTLTSGYLWNPAWNPIWQEGTQTFINTSAFGTNPYVVSPPTPEQQAAWKAQEAKLQVIAQRAEGLLLAHLTAVQRATWLAEHYVDVVAPSGRRYRLRGGHGNDHRLAADGTPERRYCVYGKDPHGSLPAADQVFVKLLALRYDERALLAAANTWDLRQGGLFIGQGADADLPALDVAA